MVYTSESEEDRHPLLTPDTLQALPAIDFSNFARRFERQSWRERHEEERRRLKQRFEVYHHIFSLLYMHVMLEFLIAKFSVVYRTKLDIIAKFVRLCYYSQSQRLW